ncbi:MAG TPA: TMEM175 family protein [Propionicimonas sp.]|nr:TMEM175 family protein [Propionicimonas sp.]HQA78733.1 TMEM175 family protein [Propionicimonas sp.]HQD97948.1 TMEM175 family protein [Propionicimonas sp.]
MASGATELHPVERMVFFTDAVVAIAMTLLILPLLESVTAAVREGLDTMGYLREHSGQLVAFALSFFIIGRFWRQHDRLFENVTHQSRGLFVLNLVWMFTIVWLPVATAMVGAMQTDALQLAIYIGTMLATSLITLAMQALLLHRAAPDGQPFDRTPLLPMLVTVGLFALALLLALVVPGLHFWSLLILLLSNPAEWLLKRRKPA